MFSGFKKETSDFLWELSFNNERPWFLEHKEQFEACLKKPLSELAEETQALMDERFPEGGWYVHVSRIYRDARRLFGRGPYKERMWFSMRKAGVELNGPCFFFEIGAPAYRFGLGCGWARSAEMEAYRKHIEANPASFERMIKKIEKLNKYVIKGEEYKRVKGDMGPEINKWYNRKWISLEYSGDFGGDVLSPELPAILVDSFAELMPMYDFVLKSFSAAAGQPDRR